MTASKADDQAGVLGLQTNQKFNDSAAVQTAVNIITKKYELGRLLASIPLTSFYELLQLGQAPVNVADGVSQEHLGLVG